MTRRSLAGGLPFLVTLLLVGGPVSAGAGSAPVTLRSSQPSPVSGAVVLTAEVPPDPGLLAVQFKLDGYVLDAPDTERPYEVVWSAASTASGQHAVTVEAHYRSGTIIASSPLRLTVVNPAAFNRTFYVDAERGNDGKDGASPATAWRTLGKANRSVVAGDTVLLRGVFTAQHIRPAVSGTPARPITFRSYPDQTAVLDGGLSGSAVWLDGSYIVLEGLRIQNVSGQAVQFHPGSHHNVLRGSTIIGTSGSWGVAINLERASDNLIEGNQIRNTGDEATNSGDSIWIANGSSRNRLLNNTLQNGGHSLMMIGGDKVGDTEVGDNVVAGNTMSNFYTTPIILSWMARRTLVEHNRISDGARNAVNYPRPGIQIQSRDNIIRYNEVFNNAGAGLFLAGYTYKSNIDQDAVGNKIYHNVFHGNGTYGLWISEKHGRSVRDNLIANNIFSRNSGGALDGQSYTIGIDHYHNPTPWPVGSLNGNRLANNIFLRQPATAGQPIVVRIRPAGHGGNLRYTLARFQATHPEAADNLEVDPLFSDEAEHRFTLRPDSPAVGRGLRIPGVAYPGSAPDIGAFQVNSEQRSSARP